jgi:2-C-methyl-D-erythritol 2,4-cyclodiphosphate synthase
MRIGHGFDVHAFGPGDHIRLGGVDIPYVQGLQAHSDGDVLLHALCDAILGAAGLGDIGQHFPDTAAEFAGIDSRLLVRRVMSLIKAEQLCIGNADLTVVAQAPKLAPFIPAMRSCIAADLALGLGRVNIKATTTEKLGAIGRSEGIAAHAVVLLTEQE